VTLGTMCTAITAQPVREVTLGTLCTRLPAPRPTVANREKEVSRQSA